MYINNVKKAKFLTFGWIQIILGAIHGIFGFVGIVETFTDFEEVRGFWGFLSYGQCWQLFFSFSESKILL